MDESTGFGSASRRGAQLPQRFRELLHDLLQTASRGLGRRDFLDAACRSLASFSGCDVLEIRLVEGAGGRGGALRCRVEAGEGMGAPRGAPRKGGSLEARLLEMPGRPDSPNEKIWVALLDGRLGTAPTSSTRAGSLWTGDTARPIVLRNLEDRSGESRSVIIGGEMTSVAFLVVPTEGAGAGVLHLGSRRREFFTRDDMPFYEAAAEALGVALMHQETQWALRERVKEVSCLYSLARVAQQPGISQQDLLQGFADLLPAGLQFPGDACARITLDDGVHATRDFREGVATLAAPILVGGAARGRVEVVYTREEPPMDEGPFLKEERSLLDEVARQIGLIIEQRETALEKNLLQDQLLRADRLATIGQMAAIAAHELSEPLGSILGFGELLQVNPELPKRARADAERIVQVATHAREMVRKLLSFSRHVPAITRVVNLNQVVEEGLYFLESRCARQEIELARDLAPGLPGIPADPQQIHHVLVNLALNAIQAMPSGGTLTITTARDGNWVLLRVEDTGPGISAETVKRIFVPFFTTKEAGEGTGLGLAVVQGIVSEHGGTVSVTSEPGHGSRFEVRLPISR